MSNELGSKNIITTVFGLFVFAVLELGAPMWAAEAPKRKTGSFILRLVIYPRHCIKAVIAGSGSASFSQ